MLRVHVLITLKMTDFNTFSIIMIYNVCLKVVIWRFAFMNAVYMDANVK